VRPAGLGACRPGDEDGELAMSVRLANSLAADPLFRETADCVLFQLDRFWIII